MESAFEIKVLGRLDVGVEGPNEICILNKIGRATDKGLEYEADPRQGKKLIEELGLNGAKGLSTPAVKPSIGNIRADKTLPTEKVTHFRALAARANYLSADRPECQFAAKEICRFMAEPILLSTEALKMLGRYLVKEGYKDPLHAK